MLASSQSKANTSLQARAEAAKNAVTSSSTCTPATVVALKQLLLHSDTDFGSAAAEPDVGLEPGNRSKKDGGVSARDGRGMNGLGRSKSRSGAAATKKKTATTTTKPTKAATTGTAIATENDEVLSVRERTALATHVVNAALKSLAEAAKPPTQSPTSPSKPTPASTTNAAATPNANVAAANKTPRHPAGARSLRRSLSVTAPLSPLPPRTLNRTASSPNVSVKDATRPPLPPSQSTTMAVTTTGRLATVECARVAFACLCSLKGPIQQDQTDFQLEKGMSALVARLIALGLHEQALKELRILKRRLDVSPETSTKTATTTVTNTGSRTTKTRKATTAAASADSISTATSIACLVEYGNHIPLQSLAIVTACQMHVLKLVAATKKPAHVEALLPTLHDSAPSSPINLLARLADSDKEEIAKAGRQMASLSQLLLSLAPSVSSTDDAIVSEPHLSPNPITAFQIQALAFRVRLTWWLLVKHQGSVDDEVLSPFARCARALVRRTNPEDAAMYDALTTAFDAIMNMVRSQDHQPATSSKSPLSCLYQILGCTAHLARRYDDAFSWLQSLSQCVSPETDSLVRVCAVSARLLAAAVKKSQRKRDVIRQLLGKVMQGLDGGLSGTVSELNELLDSLLVARRAVVGFIRPILGEVGSDPAPAGVLVFDHDDDDDDVDVVAASKDLILRFPRFLRRWMGSPPGKDVAAAAAAKQALQFDQRRHTVMQHLGQVLDAALVVLKCDMATGDWQLLDDVLQHCAALLCSVADPALPTVRAEQSLSVYHVKISSLYFSKFLELRKPQDSPNGDAARKKTLLQALSRSIDVVKDSPLPERERAQLSTKVELFVGLCRELGRPDDAVRTLRSIGPIMVQDGVLSDVTAALASQPPVLAWALNDKAASLSRTLRSIAKLDRSCDEWTFVLPETERAAVLEHLLHFGGASGASSQSKPVRLHDPRPAALLRIYAPDKYPIRRFRLLVHIQYQNIGEELESDELSTQLEQARQQLQRKDKADDAALVGFIPHLRALHTLLQAISDSAFEMPVDAVRESIAAWKAMTKTCRTRQDLFTVVDDPEDLLDQLLSLSQLASLRGDSTLQLSLAELCASLANAMVAESGPPSDAPSSPSPTLQRAHDSLILSHRQLAALYLNFGCFAQASDTLDRTRLLIDQNEGISRGIVADFHLSLAEYHAGVGAMDQALESLSKVDAICSQSKARAIVTLANASLIRSTVSLQTGSINDAYDAYDAIRSSVRMLSHEWSKLETESYSAETSMSSEASSVSVHSSSSSSSSLSSPWASVRSNGPRLWRLVTPLFRSLMHMSSFYAYIGWFQQTVYYAELAHKIAENARSPLLIAKASAWIGDVYMKGSTRKEARVAYDEAAENMPHDACASRVLVARQIADFYGASGEQDKARDYFHMAEDTIRQLGVVVSIETAPKQPCKEKAVARGRSATVGAEKVRVAKATRTAKSVTTGSQATKPAKSTAAVKINKTAPAPSLPDAPLDVYQSSLKTAVMLSRAVTLIHQEDWSSALSTLEQLKGLPKLPGTLPHEHVATAVSLIGHSMEQMISDPVFSVVQDSTLSFPAVCGSSSGAERKTTSISPTRKGRGERRSVKERDSRPFAEALRRAKELLVEAHGAALSASDSSTLHRISTLLQSTAMLLSAISGAQTRSVAASLGPAAVAVDASRNSAWAREQTTLKPSSRDLTTTALEVTTTTMTATTATVTTTFSTTNNTSRSRSSRRCSLDAATDPDLFQNKYVELIPKNWSVISLSLSDSRHDLCISKLQAGHSPFILRLPLERANCRDADSDIFNFEHGRSVLHSVIKLANKTSHSARDFKARGEGSAWWAERTRLDERLRELLETMETTWLGGFRGIFSQHRHQAEALARFQKSFQQVLDRRLPSRNHVTGSGGGGSSRKKLSKASVTLDPRILELFIGLGEPIEEDQDFDEALNDLLYFVVDVLQFHGERNAYDEIDFDAMVVDTSDALRAYHASARKGTNAREEGAHTVLVLDRALHEFPWESLPCMQGLAVSRVPSLEYLRQLLTEGEAETEIDAKDLGWSKDEQRGRATQGAERGAKKAEARGRWASTKAGTFILNPSADLVKTQGFFQPRFERQLGSWTGLVEREPSEAEMERALSSSDIVLYFGHGSGAQYIRGQTVRRLERCCATAFLMGCSSAALNAPGGFECYGPVWNYMLAGSPAVVGTLWDVTDGDIDRFAGRAFEEWGLLASEEEGKEASSKLKLKHKRKALCDDNDDDDENDGGDDCDDAGDEQRATRHKLSLVEAVSRARGVCRFRYLNAAAVVVYGIPVYLRDNEK